MHPPYLRTITWGAFTVFMAIAAVVAVAFPIHASDALTFGTWARLIAGSGHFQFPNVSAAYSRPLFYFLEGWAWRTFGYHDAVGRLLCGLFSAVLIVALVWLVRGRAWGRVTAALVVLFVLTVPVFAEQVVSTLTDVFVAAFVALTAAIAFRGDFGRWWTPVLLGVVSALAVLAKPSAVPAVAGIACAQLLFREPLAVRLVRRVLPLVGGTAVALVYYVHQAGLLGLGVSAFLQSGVRSAYYSHLADVTRRSAILDAAWFGSALRTLLIFTFVYVVLRVVGVGHVRAAFAGVPAAAIGAWLLPWIGARESHPAVGAFTSASSAIAWALTCGVLIAAVRAPPDSIPSRRELAMLALVAVGPVVAWMAYATYELRFLAPAWPGLLALTAVSATPAVAALAVRPALALAPIVGLVVAVSFNVYNVDGLHRSGWDQWRRTPAAKRFDVDTTRAIVLPALAHALGKLRTFVGPSDKLFTPEGAFSFFYPGRVDQAYPTACSQLAGYRAFVLTTDQGSRAYMQDFLHVSGDPSHWAGCEGPRLRQLTDGADGYAVFSVAGR